MAIQDSYSVWVRPTVDDNLHHIATYKRVSAAIRRAEKAFDTRGYHTAAVIDNATLAVVHCVHA